MSPTVVTTSSLVNGTWITTSTTVSAAATAGTKLEDSKVAHVSPDGPSIPTAVLPFGEPPSSTAGSTPPNGSGGSPPDNPPDQILAIRMKSMVGPIVGGCIGGLAVVAALAAVVFWLRRRRQLAQPISRISWSPVEHLAETTPSSPASPHPQNIRPWRVVGSTRFHEDLSSPHSSVVDLYEKRPRLNSIEKS